MATTTVHTTLGDTETRTGDGALAKVMATSDSLTLTVLRIGLALVILPHGLQKALGAFGGYGFGATMGYFQSMGIPSVFAFLAICAEFLGPIGLLAGLLTRVAAFGITVNMIVAALMVHLPNGFFMNWSGQQAGEGYEFHILAAAMGIALMMAGGGRWSVDRSLWKNRHAHR